jgi:hypothetical protein
MSTLADGGGEVEVEVPGVVKLGSLALHPLLNKGMLGAPSGPSRGVYAALAFPHSRSFLCGASVWERWAFNS